MPVSVAVSVSVSVPVSVPVPISVPMPVSATVPVSGAVAVAESVLPADRRPGGLARVARYSDGKRPARSGSSANRKCAARRTSR